MLTYILPVALFVVTLVIILALRAEDRKSRSLQTVKEKISLFRSESQRTMAMINETAKDACERVEAKKRDTLDLISSVDASLANLSNHRNDLSALEAVCRGYELALDRLKVQTEHAEDRIRVVQSEVEKANQVDAIIQSFHNEVEALKGELGLLSQHCQDLMAKTSDELDAVSDSHRAKAEEMLGRFESDLSSARSEFSAYVEGMKGELDERHEAFKSFLDTGFADLDSRKDAVSASCDAAISSFNDSRTGLEAFVEESRGSLEALCSEIDAHKAEIEAGLEDERIKVADSKAQSVAGAKAEFTRLTNELMRNSEEIRTAVSTGRGELEATLESLKSELDELRSAMEKEAEDDRAKAQSERDEALSAARAAFSAMENELEERSAALSSRMESENSSFSSAIQEARNGLDSYKASLDSMLEEGVRNAESGRDEAIANAKAEFDRLKEELQTSSSQMKSTMMDERSALDASLKARRSELDSFLETVEKKLSELENSTNVLSGKAEGLKNDSDAVYRAFVEKLEETSSSSQTSFASTLVSGEDNLARLANDLRNRFENESSKIFEDVRKAQDDFARLHQKQKSAIESEEADYINRCRADLASAMDSEVARVDGVFKSMLDSSTEQLGNFARKLTEIKEAVSMLNQGVSESLARTSEKLSQVQTRMASSEASLAETQNKVTAAKEELFNIQKEHKRFQDEVTKAQKELEWLQGKAQSAKRERQNEEARLVRLQMEGKSRPSDEDFVGEEEEIPLGDDE